MKHTRLLEIIREEIAGALNEKKGNVELPSGTPTSAAQQYINKGIDISFVDKNGKTTFKEAQLEGEKRKKLAEKYQLDEETINEMASVIQLKNQLEKQGRTDDLEAVKAAEQVTLNKLKDNPEFSGEGKNIRLKGYVKNLKKELKDSHGINLQVLLSQVAAQAEDAGDDFKDDIATNTIEKNAAAQILGTEKSKPGPQADPNKPKKEKPASTGKKGRPAGEPKSEKTATLTKGDDGFDDVSYSDVEVDDKEATQNIGSDKTAQKLGKAADVSENPDYNRILTGLQNKRKKSKEGVLSPEDMKLAINIINTAKDKYKFTPVEVEKLRAEINL